MDGFHILSSKGIEQALQHITDHWGGTEGEHGGFRAWAWAVASVCETYAGEDLAACMELLHAETASLHRVIAERLCLVHSISDALVSRRAFLQFLEGELQEPQRAAA
jgi:hypothetical protein